jgi:hypothetical protein
MITRRSILKEYQDLKQGSEVKLIDDLCGKKGSTFELQIQQQFFKRLINDHQELREMLLYHQIGSGKTLTSIVIAEEHMKINPDMKVLVILPARLKTNFYNELMYFSAYGKIGDYINLEDYILYSSLNTTTSIKDKIYKEFVKMVDKKYTIISFERFRIDCANSGSPREYLVNLCNNKVVIIDEVHNLINFKYKLSDLALIEDNKYPRPKRYIPSSSTLFLKTMVKYARPSSRFIFLTATPIFDNVKEFTELVKIMNAKIDINAILGNERMVSIDRLIPLLAGKVSYFPGSSEIAYPSVSYVNHDVTPSDYQMKMCKYIRPFMFSSEEPNNSYFSLERRASILAFIDKNSYKEIKDKEIPNAYKKTFKETIPFAVRNPERYMPKIKALIDQIETSFGKQLVYSSFIEYGVELTAELLMKRGWIDIKKVLKGEIKNPENYKCFARWDGLTKNEEKDAIKTLVNSLDNLDGKILRLVIGSPAMREGVSFKHIQDYHLLDPVWNQSTKTQVEGRAIRFCSHYDIPEDHPVLKRHTTVHIYKLKYPDSPTVEEIGTMNKLGENISIDSWIYDNIIIKKYKKLSLSEEALRKVAFDYYLFRRLYKKDNKSTPEKYLESESESTSIYSLSENIRLGMKNKEVKVRPKKNTCLPKQRRPPCSEGYEIRLNKNDNECCYKIPKKKNNQIKI